MKIALASDHAGFELKEKVSAYLTSIGIEVENLGTHTLDRVDYPEFAEKVAARVANHEALYGILVCGTGLGMMLAANKVPGIRAVPANDSVSARMAREHNDANILTMGGRLIDEARMKNIIDTWLSTEFAGGQHAVRLHKIDAIEKRSHPEAKA